MISKLPLSVFIGLIALAVVNSQFFSSNDGILLPRNGKRSYLDTLLGRKPTFINGESNAAASGDHFYKADKMSFLKTLQKFGKRGDLKRETSSENDNNDDDNYFFALLDRANKELADK